MMTSLVHDSSDGNGPDDQQQQIEPDNQSQGHEKGNFQPGTAVQNPDYAIPSNHLEMGHTMAPTAFPYMDPYYGSMIAYAGQPAIHPHLMGVLQPAVPLPSDAVEEPVYVNAKQYHGIMRRRQSRAKADAENKLIKCRKPYLHESRHLHALKRARGDGGRFLNSKPESNQQEGDPSNDLNVPSLENPSSKDNEHASVALINGTITGIEGSGSGKHSLDGESPSKGVAK